jgi:hypothetical protein
MNIKNKNKVVFTLQIMSFRKLFPSVGLLSFSNRLASENTGLHFTGQCFSAKKKRRVFLGADFEDVLRRQIRLIEINAKCRYLKKNFTCKGTLRHVFYLPNPPSPSYTLNKCIRVYSILIQTGRVGEGQPERRL